jgi:hypothetical protein
MSTDTPEYNKAADYNKDKTVTPAEQKRYDREQLKGDTLSERELARDYGYALKVMKSDDELWTLFQRAANARKGQWTATKFQAALMNTKWWANNSEYARKAMTAKALGGADWEATLENARLVVQAEATNQGVPLEPSQIDDLAEQAVANGWDQDGRQQLLANAIAGFTPEPEEGEFMRGAGGNLQEYLMQTAARNGLQLSNDYFASAARSVAMGLSTADDWERQVREQAASLWPTLSDQIMSGSDARGLASGYLNRMAETFEVDPSSISLNDPLIREAFAGADDKGQPTVESLWAFERRLRNDPRWMNTRQAGAEISNVARSVMETFGLVG